MSGICKDALASVEYQPEVDGEILHLRNGVDAIDYAYQKVTEARQGNHFEPVVIAGYSWGGAAALDLTHKLNDRPVLTHRGTRKSGKPAISVDLLFLVDPELDGRTLGQIVTLFGFSDNLNSRSVPAFVPRNVNEAVTINAVDPSPVPFFQKRFQDGVDYLPGATNITLFHTPNLKTGQMERVDHWSIIREEIGRPLTVSYFNLHLKSALR